MPLCAFLAEQAALLADRKRARVALGLFAASLGVKAMAVSESISHRVAEPYLAPLVQRRGLLFLSGRGFAIRSSWLLLFTEPTETISDRLIKIKI